jgi:hypothetical protein
MSCLHLSGGTLGGGTLGGGASLGRSLPDDLSLGGSLSDDLSLGGGLSGGLLGQHGVALLVSTLHHGLVTSAGLSSRVQLLGLSGNTCSVGGSSGYSSGHFFFCLCHRIFGET